MRLQIKNPNRGQYQFISYKDAFVTLTCAECHGTADMRSYAALRFRELRRMLVERTTHVHYCKTTDSILGKINLEYMQNGNIVLYYILYELQEPQTEHTNANH
jgi:hypothetical protein